MYIKRFSLCFLLCFSALAIAQAQYNNITKKTAAQFFKTTTYVELSGFREFDAYLAAAMKAYWTVTPYKFATPDELEEMVRNKDISMLRIISTVSSKSGLDNDYAVMGIFLGGYRKMSLYQTNDILQSIRFESAGAEKYAHEAGYRVDFLVKEMNDSMLEEKEKFAGNKNAGQSDNLALLQTKTLLVPREALEEKVTTPAIGIGKVRAFKEDAFEGYRYKYKVMPLADIKKMLADTSAERKQYCFFVSWVDSGSKPFRIYDLETRERIAAYYTNTKNPPVTRRDMETFSDAIAGKKK